MAIHTDATGYLLDLKTQYAEAWFALVCDLAISSSGQAPMQGELETLWRVFHGVEGYAPTVASPPPLPAQSVPPAPQFLAKLSGFSGYKRLSPDLLLNLTKQVTLIFGKNGSGKTSICQAIKILSSGETPVNPLYNARESTRPIPSFTYRLSTTGSDVAWTPQVGYGSRTDAFKYFDSTIATRHTSGALPVDSSVQIVVFRLEIFEYARAYVQAFQAFAAAKVAAEKESHQTAVQQIKTQLSSFVAIDQPPFVGWSATNCIDILDYVQNMPTFDAAKLAELTALQSRLDQLHAASTEAGLQNLRNAHALFSSYLQDVRNFQTLVKACEPADITTVRDSQRQKQAAIAELSRNSFPPHVDHAKHHALITSASQITDFSAATEQKTQCPLCYEYLSAQSASTFRSYSAYLTSTLQQEAQLLYQRLATINSNLSKARQYRHRDYQACQPYLPPDFVSTLAALVQVIASALPHDAIAATPDSLTPLLRVNELDAYIAQLGATTAQYLDSINTSAQGQTTLKAEILRITGEIATLQAHRAVETHREAIRTAASSATQHHLNWTRVDRYSFTALLAALTRKGRLAHTDLVRSTFEASLSREYQRLCGATSQEMGVQLHSVGDQQDIVVSPRIGADPVHRVLSEGEQKIHALAVFFCEATMATHQILVLDDPVTSFDYNNVSNLAMRIRDLARDQPTTQLIIFTHQWDFFINLQTVFNRSGLGGRISVQVLEDRATVKEYVEKWPELCALIDGILASGAEPTTAQKEEVSGYLRRLIERLTNAEVFNEQRHQYRAKSLPISDFVQFTKLVPLQIVEANQLRDLYAELSPPEHDDVRNYYASKSGHQFRLWYAQIKTLQVAINGRKPP
ncbi:MAG: AAA family ATPase [Burkholderiaceae bacterium]|nr:AAA family ATPase [Polaromonas sp.]MDO8778175.1 AAA family ATPase [Burkholderiaceae bacterium]